MQIEQVLKIAEIVIAVLLSILILLQQGGGGLGTVFGGGGGESYRTKRGAELVFYRLTILLAVLLAANSIALFVVLSN